MKKILLITIALFAIQFTSCKKESDNSVSAIYTITEYRNSKLFRKYVYSPNRYYTHTLLHFYSYDYNGSMADSVQFFYSGNQLDSLHTHSVVTGEKYLTTYGYENGQMKSIDKWYSHNYNVKLNFQYTNYDQLDVIEYTTSSQPSRGVLGYDWEGNLEYHSTEYVASIFNENFESNSFTHLQNYNVMSPFWVIDPLLISSSKKLEAGHWQFTRSTNDGSSNPNAQWYYKNNKWDIEYTFAADGNVLSKTVLDTNQQVVDLYEYEYMQN